MAFIKIPEELLEANITPVQFRVLCNLIKLSFEDGHSYVGYESLARYCHSKKGAIARTIKELEALGFIRMSRRLKGTRTNDIELTLENGFLNLSGRFEGTVRERDLRTRDESLSRTHDESVTRTHSESARTHGEYGRTHDEYVHKDIRFKYLDLNTQSRVTRAREESAPADVTAGRSMPTSGSAGSASKAEAEGSQLDIEDLCLWQAFKSEFPQRSPWFQLVRAQHRLIMRGIGKMGDDMLCRAWPEVSDWFSGRGFKIEKAAQNQRFYSEIVIKEAV